MIFEKIRERLQKQSKEYIESAERETAKDYRWMDEMAARATEEAIDIVNEVEAEYNNGWISVDDRLPDIETKYLVCLENGGITISKFETILDGNGYLIPIWKNCIKTKVEYWQPLPEPYIPKEEPLWKESMMNHFTRGE